MNQSSLPPSSPPVKKRAWWLRLRPVAVVTVLLVLGLLGGLVYGVIAFTQHNKGSVASRQVKVIQKTPNVHAGTVTVTHIITPAGQWITVQKFNGSGSKKTMKFTVSNNWRINWQCNLASHNNTNYYIIIHANSAKNVLLDNSIETTCSKSNTHSFSQLHKGGEVYLSILSQGGWSIQVQDLK